MDQLTGIVPVDVQAHDNVAVIVKDKLDQAVGRGDKAAEQLGIEHHVLPRVDASLLTLCLGQPVVDGLGGRPYPHQKSKGFGQ